jgi:hypothetical protein
MAKIVEARKSEGARTSASDEVLISGFEAHRKSVEKIVNEVTGFATKRFVSQSEEGKRERERKRELKVIRI